MADDVGEVFVRVRPDTAGFSEDANKDVSASGDKLAKVFLAAFAAGLAGLGYVVDKSVKAAEASQTAYAALGKEVTNVGAKHEVAGQSIQSVIDKQATLYGFKPTDLVSSFTSLVSATHNTAKAFNLLELAENTARESGQPVASAASAIALAYEGSAKSLRAYGVVTVPVIAAETRLAASHTDATAALKAEAEQTDRVLTGREGLADLRTIVGGQAAVAAKTAKGELGILGAEIDLLSTSLGSQLLPVLTAAAQKIGEWADALAASKSAQADVASLGRDLITVFKDTEDVAETLGPVLLGVAKGFQDVASDIGAPGIAAGVAVIAGALGVYKAVAIAQSVYAAALKATAGAEATTAELTQAHTAAITENTAALRGQAVAAAESAGAVETLGVAEVAATEETAGFDAAALGKGLFTLAGGWATVAVAGIAAITVGLVHLLGKASQTQQALRGLDSSASTLGTDTQNAASALKELQSAQKGGNLAEITAEQNAYNAALSAQSSATDKQKESIQNVAQAASVVPQSGLNHFLRQALSGTVWQGLIGGVNQAATDGAAGVKRLDNAFGSFMSTTQNLSPPLVKEIGEIEELAQALGRVPSTVDIKLILSGATPASITNEITQGQRDLEGIDAEKLALDLPTSPIGGTYIEKVAAATASATSGTAQLTAANLQTIKTAQEAITTATSQQDLLNQEMSDSVYQGSISLTQAVQQAKQNLFTIGQSIATNIGDYITAPLTLASDQMQVETDKISEQLQTVTTRFAGASQALTNSGNKINLGQAQLSLETLQKSISINGKQLSTNTATALAQLRAQLSASPAAGQEEAKAELLNYETAINAVKTAGITVKTETPAQTAQQQANIQLKQTLNQGLQDRAQLEELYATNDLNRWTLLLDEKKISLKKYNSDVAALLAKDVDSFKNAGSVPGGALIKAQVAAEVTGLAQQYAAVQAVPRAGTGLEPSINYPLVTQQQNQQQLASYSQQTAENTETLVNDNRTIATTIASAIKNLPAGLTAALEKSPALQRQYIDPTGRGH